MHAILLSIHPEHVKNILNGTKKYEYRRVIPRKPIDKILIYATSPVMKVVAEATVEETISNTKADLWEKTKEFSGISQDFYVRYFCDKKTAHAFALGNIKVYNKPKPLSAFGIKTPPQSFVYVC